MKEQSISAELRAYMTGIGTAGGNNLKNKMAKEKPDYYSDMAKARWKKAKEVEAVDKSV